MLQYTAFITGANRGLGLEFTRQYAAEGWRVLATCRDLVHAKELQHLAQYADNIDLLQLDVTNPIQLQQLSEKFANQPIDLLVNNAGTCQKDDLASVNNETMKQTFSTNALAPLNLSKILCHSIALSHLKTIVAISSKMGSTNDNHSGEYYSYRTSKSALNMLMKNLAIDLKPQNIKVFIFHPGWVKTDMGGPNASISAEDSVAHMRQVLSRLKDHDSGSFHDYQGNIVPW